jgi:hypothetical protein
LHTTIDCIDTVIDLHLRDTGQRERQDRKKRKGAVVGVSKMSVSLVSKTDAERTYIVMSSRKGNFVFADVPEGDYTLTVWLSKYGDTTKVITKDIKVTAAKNTGSVSIGSIRIN